MIDRLRVRIPAGAAGEFSPPESTLCADSHSVSVPPLVLPQWHVKDTGHSAKRAGGRLHLNTHTPLTQRSRSGLTLPLSRHSVVTYPETSSHATCQGTFDHSQSRLAKPLWTDPGLKSGISLRELISTLKNKAQAGNKLSNSLSKSSHAR